MKRNSPPKRRDRISGKGSPYAKGHKAPYRYPFPTGKERMEQIARLAGAGKAPILELSP